MTRSAWPKTWVRDFDRVWYSMTSEERSRLRGFGLMTVDGRRAFIAAAARMGLDVSYSAYIMERAVVTGTGS